MQTMVSPTASPPQMVPWFGKSTAPPQTAIGFWPVVTAFYDLNEDVRTKHFAGHRLGCWVNRSSQDGPDPIVFDVWMQGKVVLEWVTLRAEVDNELAVVVKEIPSVQVNDNLVIDFKEKVGRARLNAMEVSRAE